MSPEAKIGVTESYIAYNRNRNLQVVFSKSRKTKSFSEFQKFIKLWRQPRNACNVSKINLSPSRYRLLLSHHGAGED